MVTYLFFSHNFSLLVFLFVSYKTLKKKLCQKKNVVAKKAYLAIVRGRKTLSLRLRT